MKEVHFIEELPKVPAVYAMYGGRNKKYVAYVGTGKELRNRIKQHLINRDSSVTTSISASMLNPDFVTEVKWWEHPSFSNKKILLAAEIVAFNVLFPSLRSRGNPNKEALKLSQDKKFKREMEELFRSKSSGKFIVPNIEYLHRKIYELEKRIQELEIK